jgi:hypothetical protein
MAVAVTDADIKDRRGVSGVVDFFGFGDFEIDQVAGETGDRQARSGDHNGRQEGRSHRSFSQAMSTAARRGPVAQCRAFQQYQYSPTGRGISIDLSPKVLLARGAPETLG